MLRTPTLGAFVANALSANSLIRNKTKMQFLWNIFMQIRCVQTDMAVLCVHTIRCVDDQKGQVKQRLMASFAKKEDGSRKMSTYRYASFLQRSSEGNQRSAWSEPRNQKKGSEQTFQSEQTRLLHHHITPLKPRERKCVPDLEKELTQRFRTHHVKECPFLQCAECAQAPSRMEGRHLCVHICGDD